MRYIGSATDDAFLPYGTFDSTGKLISLGTQTYKDANIAHNPSHGFALGGGIYMGSARFGVSPEFRYTRWVNGPFDSGIVKSTSNQFDLFFNFAVNLRSKP